MKAMGEKTKKTLKVVGQALVIALVFSIPISIGIWGYLNTITVEEECYVVPFESVMTNCEPYCVYEPRIRGIGMAITLNVGFPFYDIIGPNITHIDLTFQVHNIWTNPMTGEMRLTNGIHHEPELFQQSTTIDPETTIVREHDMTWIQVAIDLMVINWTELRYGEDISAVYGGRWVFWIGNQDYNFNLWIDNIEVSP